MPWYSTSHADNGLEVAVHCRVVNRRGKNGVGDVLRTRTNRTGPASSGTAVVRYGNYSGNIRHFLHQPYLILLSVHHLIILFICSS